MARRYDPFPNRITEVSRWKATDELTPFDSEMCLEAAACWDLPPSHVAIIRAYMKDGTILERSYRSPGYAHRFIRSLLKSKIDFTILTENTIRDTLPQEEFNDQPD